MRHHGALLLRLDPVQQIHGAGLGIVEAGHLLSEQAQQKGLQVEVAVQQAELLEHQLGTFLALGAFVLVHLLAQDAADLFAGVDHALDRLVVGEMRVLADKSENAVERSQKVCGLLLGQVRVAAGGRGVFVLACVLTTGAFALLSRGILCGLLRAFIAGSGFRRFGLRGGRHGGQAQRQQQHAYGSSKQRQGLPLRRGKKDGASGTHGEDGLAAPVCF